MSQDWNTKYGPRRVRRDPPTLEEAIFAAIGITDDQEQQAEIASALMGLPYDEVLVEVKKQGRALARTATRVIAGEQGAQRSVVVERRVVNLDRGRPCRERTERADEIARCRYREMHRQRGAIGPLLDEDEAQRVLAIDMHGMGDASGLGP